MQFSFKLPIDALNQHDLLAVGGTWTGRWREVTTPPFYHPSLENGIYSITSGPVCYVFIYLIEGVQASCLAYVKRGVLPTTLVYKLIYYTTLVYKRGT